MKIHQWQQRTKSFTLVDDTKAKKYSVKFIKDRDAILDIGCGDCILFDIIKSKRNNCKFYGFDIVPDALKICKEKSYTPINDLNKTKGKFNVITMFECFEHLDYEGRLEQIDFINKKLEKDGYFIMSFPYVSSLLSLIHYNDNPEHKMPYPIEKNIRSLFANYEFVDKIYFNPWLNPIKILHCILTGLDSKAYYNNICYVLRKKN
jgi:hypothetical protein